MSELVIRAMDDTALAEALQSRGQQDDGLAEAVRRDELRIEALSRDFYAESLLTREEFLAARTELLRRLEGNRSALARRDRRGVLGAFVGRAATLRQSWEAANMEWRRSIPGAVLDRVEIMPGRAGRLPFDVQRVRPVWKH